MHKLAPSAPGTDSNTNAALLKTAIASLGEVAVRGVGMAKMRRAIADGFRESMTSMSQGGLSPQEAMHMMITTQYVDMLKDFATNPNKSAIMVPK